MLWPIVQPFEITCWVLGGLVVLATLAAPLFKWKRERTFWWAMALGSLAFVPSCAVLMKVVNADRLGLFENASFSDVHDPRVERFLPPTATDLTIDKQLQGFRARYKITEAELASFLDDHWNEYGHLSKVKRGETTVSAVDAEGNKIHFGDLNWPLLEHATEYHSPTAANGAGFFIWYSPATGTAYERASYW